MHYMNESSPVSIRLTEDEQIKLKEIGGGKSVAAGVKELLRLYKAGQLEEPKENELSILEYEIEDLKKSPFGFDKKEIQLLEKELAKAKESYKKKKVESIKERFMKLVNSAG
jgi:hypothetical protein